MRLTKDMIEFLGDLIIEALQKNRLVKVNDKEAARLLIRDIVHRDLKVEDDLDKEVHQILEQFADRIDRDDIQYYEMFKMVKKQLVKERKLIL